MSLAGILPLLVKIRMVFRAKAADPRFCTRMSESAAQPTGLMVNDAINAKLNKPSPTALHDSTIVANQFLKEAVAPSAHHCNITSQMADAAPTRCINVGCLLRSFTTSTTSHENDIGLGESAAYGLMA